jgi:hypothetical protein
MQFIFGGDYLFRIATIGILISILIRLIFSSKEPELKLNQVRKFFIINHICLFVLYAGMMLKVAHIMNTQIEKDILLDFIGIPAILISVLYSFSRVEMLLQAAKSIRILFMKQILLPWVLFIFSFLFYAAYSVILTRG